MRLPTPRSGRCSWTRFRTRVGPTRPAWAAALPRCEPPSLSCTRPYRLIHELAMPQLQNEKSPEVVAVVGGVVGLVLAHQVFQKRLLEIAALQCARRKQNIPRKFPQPRVGFEPGSHRNP